MPENELLTVLVVGLAGGLGASLRLLVDGLVKHISKSDYPFGTLVVNVTGSFIFGLLVAQLGTSWAGTPVLIGILGGYTTFSAASWQTFALSGGGELTKVGLQRAASYALGTIIASVMAVAFGLRLGGLAFGACGF